MAEYKDIADLKKQIYDFKRAVYSTNGDYLTGYVCALSAVEGIIAGLPDVDAEEVVRCKDCKHHESAYDCHYHAADEYGTPIFMREYDFCSYGERKGSG